MTQKDRVLWRLIQKARKLSLQQNDVFSAICVLIDFSEYSDSVKLKNNIQSFIEFGINEDKILQCLNQRGKVQ